MAIKAMENKVNIQYNKLTQLDNSMLMYSVYNTETLEKLINTVHNIHNTTSSHERTICQTAELTDTQLSICTLPRFIPLLHKLSLYLRTIQDKYIALYR